MNEESIKCSATLILFRANMTITEIFENKSRFKWQFMNLKGNFKVGKYNSSTFFFLTDQETVYKKNF